jgi:hypothetical protein
LFITDTEEEANGAGGQPLILSFIHSQEIATTENTCYLQLNSGINDATW